MLELLNFRVFWFRYSDHSIHMRIIDIWEGGAMENTRRTHKLTMFLTSDFTKYPGWGSGIITCPSQGIPIGGFNMTAALMSFVCGFNQSSSPALHHGTTNSNRSYQGCMLNKEGCPKESSFLIYPP